MYYLLTCFVVVQSLSHVQLFVTPWTAAHQASLSFTISQSLHRFISIVLMMLSELVVSYTLLIVSYFYALPYTWIKFGFFPFVNVSYINLISSTKEPRREEKKGFPPLSCVPKIYTPYGTFQILLRFPEHVLLKTKEKKVF